MVPQNIAESPVNITSILNNFKSFIKRVYQTLRTQRKRSIVLVIERFYIGLYIKVKIRYPHIALLQKTNKRCKI